MMISTLKFLRLYWKCQNFDNPTTTKKSLFHWKNNLNIFLWFDFSCRNQKFVQNSFLSHHISNRFFKRKNNFGKIFKSFYFDQSPTLFKILKELETPFLKFSALFYNFEMREPPFWGFKVFSDSFDSDIILRKFFMNFLFSQSIFLENKIPIFYKNPRVISVFSFLNRNFLTDQISVKNSRTHKYANLQFSAHSGNFILKCLKQRSSMFYFEHQDFKTRNGQTFFLPPWSKNPN